MDVSLTSQAKKPPNQTDKPTKAATALSLLQSIKCGGEYGGWIAPATLYRVQYNGCRTKVTSDFDILAARQDMDWGLPQLRRDIKHIIAMTDQAGWLPIDCDPSGMVDPFPLSKDFLASRERTSSSPARPGTPIPTASLFKSVPVDPQLTMTTATALPNSSVTNATAQTSRSTSDSLGSPTIPLFGLERYAKPWAVKMSIRTRKPCSIIKLSTPILLRKSVDVIPVNEALLRQLKIKVSNDEVAVRLFGHDIGLEALTYICVRMIPHEAVIGQYPYGVGVAENHGLYDMDEDEELSENETCSDEEIEEGSSVPDEEL